MKKEDLKYMKMADDVAQNSLDRSSKVGAVILTKENEVIVGWNTLPIGCSEDDERFISPAKYDWTLHAEQSVICACSKSNKSSLDATMYINLFPCAICAGFIINSGISRIVCDKEPDLTHPRYGESWKIALTKLKEAKIKIIYLNFEANRKV